MKKTISSSQYLTLIKWLTNRRISLDLSMRDLSKLLNRPHSFVQRIEQLERRLDVFEYTVYCAALGLDPAEGLKIMLADSEQCPHLPDRI